MNGKSRSSARSGGVLKYQRNDRRSARVAGGMKVAALVLLFVVVTALSPAGGPMMSEASAKSLATISYQYHSSPWYKSSPRGVWLKALPRKYTRDSVEKCDWRIVPVVVSWLKRYHLRAHDCQDNAHVALSDHKTGIGVDLVPADGDWRHIAYLAHKIGWSSRCATIGCPGPVFRWIGYNGAPDKHHGSPAYLRATYGYSAKDAAFWGHLHVSFRHDGYRPLIGKVGLVAVPRAAHTSLGFISRPQPVIGSVQGTAHGTAQYPISLPEAPAPPVDTSRVGPSASDELVAEKPEPVSLTGGPSSSGKPTPAPAVDLTELALNVEEANQGIDTAMASSRPLPGVGPSDKFDLVSVAFEATNASVEKDKSSKKAPPGPDPDGAVPVEIGGPAPSDKLLDPAEVGVPYTIPGISDTPTAHPHSRKRPKTKNGRYVLHGKTKADMVFNYFNESPLLKLVAFQAAALVGNISTESAGSFNPKIHQFGGGVGRGIVQWTVNDRWQDLLNWAKKHGRKPTKLHTQLDFISHELRGSYRGAWSALRRSRNLADATYVVERDYERPQPGSTGTRIGRARVALCGYMRNSHMGVPCRSR